MTTRPAQPVHSPAQPPDQRLSTAAQRGTAWHSIAQCGRGESQSPAQRSTLSMCRACMQCRVMAVMRTVGAPSASAVVRAAPLLLPYRRRREPPTPAHAAVLLSASAVMPAERWHCCRSVGPTAEAARARALVRREAVPRWPPAAAAPALAAAGHSLLPPTDHHAMVINRMRTQRERERARERERGVRHSQQ